MIRLTGFELGKIWGKKRFLLSCLILLALDFFLLWYTNLPGESRAGLSAYKAFQREISDMTETEKGIFITEMKETIDGIGFVQEVLMLRGMSDEMGDTLAAQALEGAPGVFEAYYEMYQSGAYLKLTDSLQKDQRLVEELYKEWEKCAGYGVYLQSVQEARNMLGGIGIFGGQNTDSDSFSARNVEKSAEDYAALTDEGIRWMPGKALTGAMENAWTDIFLLLSVFLFVGSLVTEEKQKKLFYITRSTRYGIGKSIGAKLAALFIHCCAVAVVLYGTNLLFFRAAVGFGEPGAALQSVASWRQSCLPVSIGEYIVLSIFTKGIVLFGFGAFLTALCIASDTVYLPYGAGLFCCGISYTLYQVIPAASKWNMAKYLNLMGILKTEHYYGAYLNFNLFGYPFSCMFMTWIVIVLAAAAGSIGSVYFYVKGKKLAIRDRGWQAISFFRPHSSLLAHECYKIMIVNKAALVLLIFGFLAGYQEWGISYYPSAQEIYYQDIMLQLEGELTEAKEALILSEQARYQEAFDRIGQIDRMVSEGSISERTGDEWKSEFYAVTAFYPSFTRVWEQYRHICENGGNFIYDTGYLYLFGMKGEGFLIVLLVLGCGVVLAFGNAAAMEDMAGTWNLLGSTGKGRRKVLLHKGIICAFSAALLSMFPFACRAARINHVFPLRGVFFRAADIPCCREHIPALPVWGLILLFVLIQSLVLAVMAMVVFGLSVWRREALGAYFLSALLLVVPLVMVLLGFSAAEKLSFYPLYSRALIF